MVAPSKRLRTARDEFLGQITSLDCDFNNWQSWHTLMNWIKRQPWSNDFFGGDKIPSRLVHPQTLANEISKYLGGPVE